MALKFHQFSAASDRQSGSEGVTERVEKSLIYRSFQDRPDRSLSARRPSSGRRVDSDSFEETMVSTALLSPYWRRC